MKKIAFGALTSLGLLVALGVSVHAASGPGEHSAYCLMCDFCRVLAHML
jgi:hypothetical protein